MKSAAVRYGLSGAAIAAVGGSAVLPWSSASGAESLRWALLGWGLMSFAGLSGGAWLAREHGRPGTGFVVAMGTSMLARLFAAGTSLAGALLSGDGSYRACLVGLAAGYVPLQVFEILWFYRLPGRAAGGALANAQARGRET